MSNFINIALRLARLGQKTTFRGSAPSLLSSTSIISTAVAGGGVVAYLNDPFAGRGYGTTTYSTFGTVPDQLLLSGAAIYAGSSYPVAGNTYTIGVSATSGDGKHVVGETFPFKATVPGGVLTAKRLLGVRQQSPSDTAGAEAWLGKPIAFTVSYGDETSWSVSVSKLQNSIVECGNGAKPICNSIPLTSGGMTLAQVAAGSADSYFTQMAQIIVNTQPTGTPVVRIGWEFNATSYAWSSFGNEANYAAAFRRAVTVMRAVSDRFKFDWCPNWNTYHDAGDGNGTVSYNPEPCYPGDAYVDIIGMDVYMFSQYDLQGDATGINAWNFKRSAPYGLDWLTTFAANHNKVISLPEWGVDSDCPQYMARMSAWIKSNNVYYTNYWNSNEGGAQCRLSDGQWPNMGAEFIRDFGPSS